MTRARLAVGVLVLCLVGGGAAIVLANGDDDGGSAPAASATARWTALRPSLLSRTEVAAARIGRFIYVVGGFERRSGRSTAAVERYDLRRDRWRRVRSMPVALNHPAAAAYRGDVYVLGGYTGRGDLRGEVASLYRYDPGRDRWSRLPDAPTRRAALAVGVVGPKLYAAGGANSGEGALQRLEIYDFAARRWTRGPDMGFAREHLAGAVAGGAFYVLAGRAAGRGNFKVAERYLPAARRWERLPDMEKPRGGIGAASVGGQGRRGRRRGAVRHDPRGRALRPRPPALDTAAGPAHAAARTRSGLPPRAPVRDRGRPRTGLLLLPGDRGA